MGWAKQRMIEQDEQGWSFTSRSVCSDCVNDPALGQIIRDEGDPDVACDFCEAQGAAPLDVLLEAFMRGIRNEYERAIDGVMWDGKEGGYLWNPKWDTWDLVEEFDTVLIGDGLIDAVREALHDTTWVERHFATRRRDVVLTEAWDAFCFTVKYETRFVFWRRPDIDSDAGAGEIVPTAILDEVGALLDRLQLITALPAGHRFWRAQTHNEPAIDHSAARLGTAPREKALTANRMSPAGIPMFYGADDAGTAIREAARHTTDGYVTAAQFELTADLAVVDFTALPLVPSIFDPELGAYRRQLLFLHRFVDQLSDKATPDHEQIDYVPTQIVTEYLLHIHDGGRASDGILYRSAITGDACVVANVPNDRCLDAPSVNNTLAFVLLPATVTTRALEPADRA